MPRSDLPPRVLLERLNRNINSLNALYHVQAQRLGFSNSAFWVLYALRSTDHVYTQNELCVEWAFPKQTLNSAVTALVRKGLVALDPAPGPHNRKQLRLTEAGIDLARRTIDPLLQAECTALAALDGVEQYLALQQQHEQLLQQAFAELAANTDTEEV